MSLTNTLVAGDSLRFSTDSPDYPPSDGWEMTYRMTPQGAGAAFSLTSTTADPDLATAFLFTKTGTESAAWGAGAYSWTLWVSKDDDRYTLDSGSMTVAPNPATATTLDLRSTAAKALAAIDAYLTDPNNLAAASYTIAGRSLDRYTRADLIAERSKWQAEVLREQAAAGIASGGVDKRRIYVRWGA